MHLIKRTSSIGVAYEQVRVTPHSETADEYHPFGFLPTLVIHEINGKQVDLKLRESQAIARYVDRVHPEPSLHLDVEEAAAHAAPADAIIPEKMWEFVSLAGAFGKSHCFSSHVNHASTIHECEYGFGT